MCNNHFIDFYANNVYQNPSDFLLGVWIGISLITAQRTRRWTQFGHFLWGIVAHTVAAFEFISKYGNEIQQF